MGKALTVLFLAILGVAWIAVLTPAIARARRRTPMSTADRFRHSMQLLSPRFGEEGRWVVVPGSVRSKPSSQRRAMRHQRVLKRRRSTLLLLVWLAVGSAGAAALGAPGGWMPHIAIDAALVGYTGFLVEAKRRRSERSRKVRPIDQRRARREVEFDFFEQAISE